jgi:hypothetical protein
MKVYIRLPDCWPPEKVDFLLDVVDQLQEAIWSQYGDRLCEYWEDHPPTAYYEDDGDGQEYDE